MIPSLEGVHFLITYGCSSECDHCFIWANPGREAGMTSEQVDGFLEQVVSLGTVTGVCGEGGESFTNYGVLLHFLRRATKLGLSASALTNAAWVTSREEAENRVAELMEAGLTSLGISTDQWHQRYVPVDRVDTLLEVCEKSGLSAARMETQLEGVMFRGRAAARLAPGMPTRPAEEFTTCPHEKLDAPSRVHLDCYGRLHLCQGLTLRGETPSEAVAAYDPRRHPIASRLLDGGPHALGQYAAERGFEPAPEYVDACQLCYRAREFLRPHFPELLGPDEMYGP
ncbi:MAG: hypothetical protein JSV79_12320 [Armatimonadota bacterium]|nr:MAG: hypothetical protein JSV79_12320 [Armatimonadota bacterium]